MSEQGAIYHADVRFCVKGYDEAARHWKPSNECRRARRQPLRNHPRITSMLDPSIWRPSVPKEQYDRADFHRQFLIPPEKVAPQQTQNNNGFNEQLSTTQNAISRLNSQKLTLEATDERTLLPTKANVAEGRNKLPTMYVDKSSASTSSSSTSQIATSVSSIFSSAMTTETVSTSSMVSQPSTTQRMQQPATTHNVAACEPCDDSSKSQEQPKLILSSESAKTQIVKEFSPINNKSIAPVSAKISSDSTGQAINNETRAHVDEMKSHTATESQNWKNVEPCETSQTTAPPPTEIAAEVMTASTQPDNGVEHYSSNRQYMTYQEFLTKHPQIAGLNASTKTSQHKCDQSEQKLESDSWANWVEVRCWTVLGIFIFFLYIYYLWLPQIVHCS